MKMVTILFRSLAVALLLLAGACKSRDYYVEKQVNSARAFALENLRELSPIKRDFIRYNPPTIMSQYYAGAEYDRMSFTGGNGFSQICFVWNVPDENLPVIVFGVSENGMRGWSPLRLYRRQFRTYEYPREQAINNAVLFAMNNMLYLKNAMLNRIRFSSPKIISTTFQLGMSERPLTVQASGKDLPNQVSMVWPGEGKDEFFVVSGLCGQNFNKWFGVTALVRNAKDVKDHTVTELYSPE